MTKLLFCHKPEKIPVLIDLLRCVSGQCPHWYVAPCDMTLRLPCPDPACTYDPDFDRGACDDWVCPLSAAAFEKHARAYSAHSSWRPGPTSVPVSLIDVEAVLTSLGRVERFLLLAFHTKPAAQPGAKDEAGFVLSLSEFPDENYLDGPALSNKGCSSQIEMLLP
jgi:hypothetical protein